MGAFNTGFDGVNLHHPTFTCCTTVSNNATSASDVPNPRPWYAA